MRKCACALHGLCAFSLGHQSHLRPSLHPLYQHRLRSLNVLASHHPFRHPFNLLHLPLLLLLSSPRPIQRILFQGFLSLAYRFSACPCVQWSAKYHLLRICLTAFLLTLHLFELPFLLKNFIDFILFFPLAFYFPYLLVLCLRMACDVMNMLFLDFF